MSRIVLIGLFASAFLIASALISPAIETAGGPMFSSAAQAESNPNATRTNKPDHFTKRGSAKQGGGGGPAGIAVSDPGAEGSKPVKGGKK